MGVEVYAHRVPVGLDPSPNESFCTKHATSRLRPAAPRGPKSRRQEYAVWISEMFKILIKLVRSDVTAFDHGVQELVIRGTD